MLKLRGLRSAAHIHPLDAGANKFGSARQRYFLLFIKIIWLNRCKSLKLLYILFNAESVFFATEAAFRRILSL